MRNTFTFKNLPQIYESTVKDGTVPIGDGISAVCDNEESIIRIVDERGTELGRLNLFLNSFSIEAASETLMVGRYDSVPFSSLCDYAKTHPWVDNLLTWLKGEQEESQPDVPYTPPKVVLDILRIAEEIATGVIQYLDGPHGLYEDSSPKDVMSWKDSQYTWIVSKSLKRVIAYRNRGVGETRLFNNARDCSINDDTIIIQEENGKWVPSISYHWGNEGGKGSWHSCIGPNIDGNTEERFIEDDQLLHGFKTMLENLLYSRCGGVAVSDSWNVPIHTIVDFEKIPDYVPVLLTDAKSSEFMESLHNSNRQHHVDTRPFMLEELAEFSEAVSRTFRDDRVVKADDIAGEIADVLICTDAFCSQYGISGALVMNAIRKKIERHRKRNSK